MRTGSNRCGQAATADEGGPDRLSSRNFAHDVESTSPAQAGTADRRPPADIQPGDRCATPPSAGSGGVEFGRRPLPADGVVSHTEPLVGCLLEGAYRPVPPALGWSMPAAALAGRRRSFAGGASPCSATNGTPASSSSPMRRGDRAARTGSSCTRTTVAVVVEGTTGRWCTAWVTAVVFTGLLKSCVAPNPHRRRELRTGGAEVTACSWRAGGGRAGPPRSSAPGWAPGWSAPSGATEPSTRRAARG